LNVGAGAIRAIPVQRTRLRFNTVPFRGCTFVKQRYLNSTEDRTMTNRHYRGRRAQALLVTSLMTILTLPLLGCSSATSIDLQPPPAAEFGFGPRASAAGLYRAQVEPVEQIRIGSLHAWKLQVVDAQDAPVVAASITVDGGMPQHGHGMPTRPRVTGEVAPGVYQVDGMRFNMGGWWVVNFRVDGAAGVDVVTFNLSL
jgi:hypothetical protein